MTYGMWILIASLIGMVWAMLRFHVDPPIILALLVCVSLLCVATMFVSEAAKDCLEQGAGRTAGL